MPTLVPFTIASRGSIWGKEKSYIYFSLLSTHRSAKLSPCKLVGTRKYEPDASVHGTGVIIEFGLKVKKEIYSFRSTFMHFILFTLGQGRPATEVFAVMPGPCFYGIKVCKVHLFPEEYLTASCF